MTGWSVTLSVVAVIAGAVAVRALYRAVRSLILAGAANRYIAHARDIEERAMMEGRHMTDAELDAYAESFARGLEAAERSLE